MDRSDIAKLCEIGVIYGQLLEQKKVEPFDNLFEAYDCFEKIYLEWRYETSFVSAEEFGYITAYANRVLVERLGGR